MVTLPSPSLRHRLGGMSADLRASILMIVAFVVFSAMAVLMRLVSDRIAVAQVVLIRQVIALALMVPLFWTARRVILHPTGLARHLARGVLAVGAMFCGLTSIIHIPLADATAIGMAEVVIATALASPVLRERVGWRRWLATTAGFLGVLIMLRPFGAGFDAYALVALAGSLCGAASMIALRLGSGMTPRSRCCSGRGWWWRCCPRRWLWRNGWPPPRSRSRSCWPWA